MKLANRHREAQGKGAVMPYVRFFSLLLSFVLAVAIYESRAQQKPLDLHGIYLEGCTCKVVCSCDLEGAMARGCHVMGVLIIRSGSYEGYQLSNVKIAFAMTDKWIRIYIQTQDAAQDRIVGEMAREIFAAYGSIESMRDADIDFSGNNGTYSLKVDGGKVMDRNTRPVYGADGKSAVAYTNYPDPLFHTIMQAKVVSGRYTDGGHEFTLEGTNSFYNQEWVVSRIP
ncbi:MAG: DUF1326 domain-containing protein [bacterium]